MYHASAIRPSTARVPYQTWQWWISAFRWHSLLLSSWSKHDIIVMVHNNKTLLLLVDSDFFFLAFPKQISICNTVRRSQSSSTHTKQEKKMVDSVLIAPLWLWFFLALTIRQRLWRDPQRPFCVCSFHSTNWSFCLSIHFQPEKLNVYKNDSDTSWDYTLSGKHKTRIFFGRIFAL